MRGAKRAAAANGVAGRLGASQPWTAVIVAALALNFAWEMLQAPLYSNMRTLSFAEGTVRCLAAAVGDAALTLLAFGIVAAFARDRAWMLKPRCLRIAAYLALGLAFTVVLESMALRSGRWSYVSAMPRLAGIGLAPLVQWLTIPVLTLWIVRRYLKAAVRT